MTTSELQDLRAVGVLGGAAVDHELTARDHGRVVSRRLDASVSNAKCPQSVHYVQRVRRAMHRRIVRSGSDV